MIKKKRAYSWLLSFCLFLVPRAGFAAVQEYRLDPSEVNAFVQAKVKDPFTYIGLAAFYNHVGAYLVYPDGIEPLPSEPHPLKTDQVLALVGHYKVLTLEGYQGLVSFQEGTLVWEEIGEDQKDSNDGEPQAQLLRKSDLNQLPQPFRKLKYAHLWEPFGVLCIGVETLLRGIHHLHDFGWGISILLLSLLFKLFILPANMLLIATQRKVSKTQARLAPELEHIKANFSGEEAHHKYMAAHKALGVTPFYTLRPLLLTLAPFPFLIAIFNVLGSLDAIAGNSFLWIKDLAHPDAVYDLGFTIPWLGNSIHILPILMTLLSILGAIAHQNKIIDKKNLGKQRLQLYLMSLGFFFIFYPFPAAMVLYWTLANMWQLIQQRFLKI